MYSATTIRPERHEGVNAHRGACAPLAPPPLEVTFFLPYNSVLRVHAHVASFTVGSSLVSVALRLGMILESFSAYRLKHLPTRDAL